MKTRVICCLLACLLLLQMPLTIFPLSFAEEAFDPDEAKALLQKGLTIYEIDREVARLNEQDKKIADQIQATNLDVVKQGNKVQESRKHAGRVLRAYYTGDRDSIWLLMFSLKSFSDVLKTYEYLHMIVQNDQRALDKFSASYEQLKVLQVKLEASRVELQKTKSAYLTQRERLVKLQEELDKQLAITAQAKAVEEQIKSLNKEWEEKGLPLFRQFFEALSLAFVDLPELFTKDGGKNISLDGTDGATFTLSDGSMNEFLQSKDALFTNLSFRFTGGKVIVSGKRDNEDIVIQGNFILIEGKDMNEVRFTVDQLDFNGYQLPDTTITSLLEEFGLSFFPRKTVPIEVTSVTPQEGKLIVKLKF
ncbi:coiled-coil domain-containing protein [Paenibacillus eucommiae]|uniref:Peptidoglycan hydrolase CwlO-like protein n=1 Tax=Paenibacillus eucommiae TaxID=1355755 RepID=A0ABS4J0G3_9BACL|nr:hypothetical protein [Paenibacillus eucommiae]MBP1992815.1 peptidoglycan hydrolase CwlO-like protein [Paenibacillus eucommiae]